MEKEFYVSYEGMIKIKAKNKKEAEEKFWEIMKDKANVINSIEKK